MITYAIAFIIALLVAYLSTPLVKMLAFKIGAVDLPDHRKVHKKPMARLGGLAIYFGFIVAVLFTIQANNQVLGICIGGTIIVLVGIVDDLRGMDAKVKLFLQIVAACVLLAFDLKIEWISNPLGQGMFYLPFWLSAPVTIIWVIGCVNTVNLIDGLDGLAAGISFIAAVTISLMAMGANYATAAILTAALAGSALGFLQHNFNPAKIFMGDTGSMFLGFILASVSIVGSIKSLAAIAILVPILALGVPIFDTLFAIFRRYKSGNPIFAPDKGHLHHRLLQRGLSVKQAVLAMYAISIVLGGVAVLMMTYAPSYALIIIAILFALIMFGAKWLGIFDHNDKRGKK
ncbi:MAG: MraY family glycosyltransferase [Bacillota bacterium]